MCFGPNELTDYSQVTLEDLYLGCDKKLRVIRSRTCPQCARYVWSLSSLFCAATCSCGLGGLTQTLDSLSIQALPLFT